MTLMKKERIPVVAVRSRPVRARALQFRYGEGQQDRLLLVEHVLGVKLESSYDPQSGTAYHLKTTGFERPMVGNGDWIVVDSFGKASLVPDPEFRTYYEPESPGDLPPKETAP